MRGVALRQLIAGRLDAVLDVGDRRGQRGDRAVDIGRRAVHRVQQGARLAQRRLRGADGIDDPVWRSAGRATRLRALVMF